MARYRGADCKVCRREGEKLYLKGDRCYTAKCAVVKRAYAPGQHGKVPRKSSDYGLRLREKQKMARFYGILERQFRKYFEEASKKQGVTGTLLLQMLETRIDNVVYRLGLAASRKQARQLVLHGYFKVNQKKVSIPSFHVKPNDVISLKDVNAKAFALAFAKLKDREAPAWLKFDLEKKEATLIQYPERKEIDAPVKEQMVIEYYSR